MGQLDTTNRRLRERCISEVREAIVAREASYLIIAHWLTTAREKELWLDDEGCECLEDFANKHFDYSRSYVSRVIAAKQAHDDVLELPIGNKIKTPMDSKVPGTKGVRSKSVLKVNVDKKVLDPPRTEAVARELAKVEGAQGRADCWMKANESGPPTAAHVAKTRREMFPPEESNGELPAVEPVDAIKSMIKKIDAIRRDIDEVKIVYMEKSKYWQRALDELDEGRKALLKLTK